MLQEKVSLMEMENEELLYGSKGTPRICDDLAQEATDAQMEKDQLILKIQAARGGKPWDESDDITKLDVDLIKGHLSRIQLLEAELGKKKSISSCPRNTSFERLELDKDETSEDLGSVGEEVSCNVSREAEDEEKEIEHSSLQDRLDKELNELDMCLEQKEAEIKQFAKGDTAMLKHHDQKKLMEMEQEKKALQKDIEDLRCKLSNISSIHESAKKLKEDCLHKFNTLKTQVSELIKKEEAQAQLLRLKQKSDEAARRFHDEIQRIKSQKITRDSRAAEEQLQSQLMTSSCTLLSKASQLLRCQIENKGAQCMEKNVIISALKAEVIRITSVVTELEAQNGVLLNEISEFSDANPYDSGSIVCDPAEDSAANEESDNAQGHEERAGQRCKCNRRALCKRKKCECRNAKMLCGAMCGCSDWRCLNR